ncbi:MAG: TldD/PmbA family protein [Pseudomonadota bacterium]
MTDTLQDLCRALLDAARAAGADAADAMAIEGRSQLIDVRAGALEQAEHAEGTDIGLRVILGQRQACVSASDTRTETIQTLADRAVLMAREAPDDPSVGLADPAELARDWTSEALQLHDPAPAPAPQTLRDRAMEAEAAALGVAGVTQVSGTSATYSDRSVHIAASNGFSGGYRRTSSGLSCVAIAGTGTNMQRDYDVDTRIFASDLRAAREIGTTAGERAVSMMDARKPPTGSFPVVYDERVASGVIGHLLSAANGAAVARGASWLLGQLETQVLPRGVSLTEDPHRPRVAGSRPFDAEGLPTARRAIVEDGCLTGWVLDLATARKLGLHSTANARRGPSAPPSPGVGNIGLTPGLLSRADLLSEMHTGLLVTSLIGSTINPNTGDYSRGASGFWVERGEITYPVNECTIAGSLPEMLKRLTPANDARPWLSRVVPSLRVEGMTIAGD